MESFLNTSTLSLLEKVAVFGERRHEVLAGNVATINTPNDRMRNLPVGEFRAASQQAIETQHSRTTPKASQSPTGPTQAVDQTIEDLFPEQLFQAVRSDSEQAAGRV